VSDKVRQGIGRAWMIFSRPIFFCQSDTTKKYGTKKIGQKNVEGLLEDDLYEFQLADLQLNFFARGGVDFIGRVTDPFTVQFHAALRDQTARLGFRRSEVDLEKKVDKFYLLRGGFDRARFDLGRALALAETADEFGLRAVGLRARMEIGDEFFR